MKALKKQLLGFAVILVCSILIIACNKEKINDSISNTNEIINNNKQQIGNFPEGTTYKHIENYLEITLPKGYEFTSTDNIAIDKKGGPVLTIQIHCICIKGIGGHCDPYISLNEENYGSLGCASQNGCSECQKFTTISNGKKIDINNLFIKKEGTKKLGNNFQTISNLVKFNNIPWLDNRSEYSEKTKNDIKKLNDNYGISNHSKANDIILVPITYNNQKVLFKSSLKKWLDSDEEFAYHVGIGNPDFEVTCNCSVESGQCYKHEDPGHFLACYSYYCKTGYCTMTITSK